ncbi:retinoid-inducible serine carboxypeptidase-like [Leptopilina heterotoma]|uniref:retinoid-inducible serine carboxypeptidase-like n=1 Tax=Leptopilina heterotoma TaxID=63436 RepID=UPI001CA8A193|nr:retinoid-inducible serine carboxypeptidase-like [Leptopilina heterotoma]
MCFRSTIFFLFLGFCQISYGKYGFRGEQEWGFVTVRPGAHIFYWLHYTTANVSLYTEKPLIIWLEGGPGVSSTGYTNFKEIGPLNLDLTNRSNSLVKDYNILFIDNPVGTGFSYTDSDDQHARSDQQIANDLLISIEKFLKEFPSFSNVSTYVVGQCYGGKIAVLLASKWLQKIKSGWNISNFKGIGISSAWISPVHSVLSWAPYLFENRLIDNDDYNVIRGSAYQAYLSTHIKDWNGANNHTHSTISNIKNIIKNVNFYNILSKVEHRNFSPYVEDESQLHSLMETQVKSALNISENIHFNVDDYRVYEFLISQLMRPAIKEVEYLLRQSNFKVFVLSGKLDLLVNSKGTERWIENLKWANSSEWLKIKSSQLIVNKTNEGYVKTCGNFRMYSVNRAGHLIAVDNPAATRKILSDLTSDDLSN